MISELRAFMTSTITVEPWTGQDVYGKATYGTAVSIAARISEKPSRVLDSAGQTVVTGATAWTDAANTVITSKDRVTLPDGSQPPLIAVHRMPDDIGIVLTTLSFGR